MEIMKAWNAALNVDCVFCHVGQVGKPLSTYDFASDTKKRKETSRIMLRAVMDTNEKFKAIGEDEPPQVRCSTCHKRSRHADDKLPAEPPKEHD
jgi:cytochrome c peroxidase